LLSAEHQDLLKTTSIGGRIALALTCVERAVQLYQVRDRRITELVEIMWRFVEQKDWESVDQAWRQLPVVDLLDAAELGWPVPVSYRSLPLFLPRVLYETLELGLDSMYHALSGYDKPSYDRVVQILTLCEQGGITIPALGRFARMPFTDGRGWGHPVPRSFFQDDNLEYGETGGSDACS
jgi:hypothetical protein